MQRRSIRKYETRDIPEEMIDQILNAGILAPSSKNIRPVEFIVVKDREMLEKLSRVKMSGAGHLKNAACGIICVANTEKADAWIEDCSLALGNMMLMAEDLGIGSVWTQIRLRKSLSGKSAEKNVRELMGIPDHYAVEAVLSLGFPAENKEPHTAEELKTEHTIHREKF